jgi:hypothetical protein
MKQPIPLTIVATLLYACTSNGHRETAVSKAEPDAATADAATPPEDSSPPPTSMWSPLGAAEKYQGHSLSEWAADWCRWTYAQTDCSVSTAEDADGSHCGAYQDSGSPVFFLDSGMPITERTACEIPGGKAIFVPIASIMVDNAGVAEDERMTEADMKAVLSEIKSSMRDLVLKLDGAPVDDLTDWSVDPTLFDYTLPPEPNWYTCNGSSGVTGKISPAYFTGFFALLPPPAPGSHTLEYAGTLSYQGVDMSAHVKLAFTVQ